MNLHAFLNFFPNFLFFAFLLYFPFSIFFNIFVLQYLYQDLYSSLFQLISLFLFFVCVILLLFLFLVFVFVVLLYFRFIYFHSNELNGFCISVSMFRTSVVTTRPPLPFFYTTTCSLSLHLSLHLSHYLTAENHNAR